MHGSLSDTNELNEVDTWIQDLVVGWNHRPHSASVPAIIGFGLFSHKIVMTTYTI